MAILIAWCCVSKTKCDVTRSKFHLKVPLYRQPSSMGMETGEQRHILALMEEIRGVMQRNGNKVLDAGPSHFRWETSQVRTYCDV